LKIKSWKLKKKWEFSNNTFEKVAVLFRNKYSEEYLAQGRCGLFHLWCYQFQFSKRLHSFPKEMFFSSLRWNFKTVFQLLSVTFRCWECFFLKVWVSKRFPYTFFEKTLNIGDGDHFCFFLSEIATNKSMSLKNVTFTGVEDVASLSWTMNSYYEWSDALHEILWISLDIRITNDLEQMVLMHNRTI